MERITIKAGRVEVECELNDTTCARDLYDALPITGFGHRWGEEIYFDIGVGCTCNNPTLKVQPGDVCFWPAGNGLAIFFGPTPLSTDKDPIPASEVEVVGRIIGDYDCLDGVPDGTEIVVSKKVEKEEFIRSQGKIGLLAKKKRRMAPSLFHKIKLISLRVSDSSPSRYRCCERHQE